MGLLTDKDAKLFRTFFKEAAMLRGIDVRYQYIIQESISIHSESDLTLSEPINMSILFDENPRLKTLKTIGWVSENPEDKPYIAYLPFDAKELSVRNVIEIPPIGSFDKSRKFRITAITTSIEFPDSWLCTLAPLFKNDPIQSDYEETNYNYMDTDDQPDKDSPNNKPCSNYKYLKVDE